MKTENEILFEEKQKFRQRWLWLILILVSAIMIFIIFQIGSAAQIEDDPMPIIIIVSSVLFILVPTILLFLNMRLETQIKKNGIYVRFFPFHLSFKEYEWNNISKSFIREYSAIGEYGGWGLRLGLSGKAFNVSGDKGLQLEFRNNKKLLIGTNKPEELKETLQRIGQLKN